MPEVGTEVNAAKRELNRALDRIEAGYQAQERFILERQPRTEDA